MCNLIYGFLKDEDGAVTVDWVVLTAGVVALALGVVVIVTEAATSPSEGIGAHIETLSVMTY